MGAEGQGPQGAWDWPSRASACWLFEPCILEVGRHRRPGSSGAILLSCTANSLDSSLITSATTPA